MPGRTTGTPLGHGSRPVHNYKCRLCVTPRQPATWIGLRAFRSDYLGGCKTAYRHTGYSHVGRSRDRRGSTTSGDMKKLSEFGIFFLTRPNPVLHLEYMKSQVVRIWVETLKRIDRLMRRDSRKPTSRQQYLHWLAEEKEASQPAKRKSSTE